MTFPAYAVSYQTRLSLGVGAVVGDCVVQLADGTFALATSAARANGTRTAGIVAQLGTGGSFLLQSHGLVQPSISGLAAGTASKVRVSATGRLERVASATVLDDVVGECDPSGVLHAGIGNAGAVGLPLAVDLRDTGSGLEVFSTGLGVAVADDGGLAISTGVGIKLDGGTASGLALATGGVKAKVGTVGLKLDASGIDVDSTKVAALVGGTITAGQSRGKTLVSSLTLENSTGVTMDTGGLKSIAVLSLGALQVGDVVQALVAMNTGSSTASHPYVVEISSSATPGASLFYTSPNGSEWFGLQPGGIHTAALSYTIPAPTNYWIHVRGRVGSGTAWVVGDKQIYASIFRT